MIRIGMDYNLHCVSMENGKLSDSCTVLFCISHVILPPSPQKTGFIDKEVNFPTSSAAELAEPLAYCQSWDSAIGDTALYIRHSSQHRH